MPNRKRKTEAKRTARKAGCSEPATSAGRARIRALPHNTVCLSTYRQQATNGPSAHTGKQLSRSLSAEPHQGAEIMLFTGVQIVRDGDGNQNHD